VTRFTGRSGSTSICSVPYVNLVALMSARRLARLRHGTQASSQFITEERNEMTTARTFGTNPATRRTKGGMLVAFGLLLSTFPLEVLFVGLSRLLEVCPRERGLSFGGSSKTSIGAFRISE
jgi:hypothetical protein